jgi:adenylate cyclase
VNLKLTRSQRLRALFFLVIGLGTTGIAFATYGFGFLDDFERKAIDERFAIRGAEKQPANIAVVAIDDTTLGDKMHYPLDPPRPKDCGNPAPGCPARQNWPFRRAFHGRLLDLIRQGDPKAVVFDVQFTQPEAPACPSQACANAAIDDDNALFEAAARLHGRIALSTTSTTDAHGGTNIFGGDSVLKKIGARPGWGNFKPDKDGAIRKVDYAVQGLKSLSLVGAEIARGRPIERSQLDQGRAWIDYVGPPDTIRSYSYSRVINGQVPPSVFRDKIVVIGATTSVLQDIHDTSTGTGMAGPEIQANAILTALRGFPLKSTPDVLNIFLILVLGFLAPALGLRYGPVVGTGAALVAGALFGFVAQLVFDHGWLVLFVYPVTALCLSTVGAIVVHYLLAAVERERVRDVFSRFVPTGVVDEVLSQTGGDLRLGGKKQTATVLFSDLRGFTSSAEHMDAADVIRVLNHYLGEMTDAILGHGGTLVSYMGDGIYAVFGAPIEQEDHADRALSAAREMVDVRLPIFNAWTQREGFGAGFQMGVGLNSGPIMSGNVGHERRLEYTAVGDTVNTASRIEGMTKGTDYSVFVSETTYAALQRAPEELTYYDEVEIRGRKGTLKLWGTSPKQPLEATPAVVDPAPERKPVEAPAQAEPI